MFGKRAQGLPLNTIIISIIVIVVLVVIVLIFTGNMGGTAGTMRSCAAQGGVCDYPTPAACRDAEGRVITGTCQPVGGTTPVCCVTVGA